MYRNAFRFFIAFVFVASLHTPASALSKYAVVKGDTLTGIARHHHVTLRSLEQNNNLRPGSILRIGQTLALSAGRYHVSPASSPLRRALNRALWDHAYVARHTYVMPRPVRVGKREVALNARIGRTALRYLGVPYAWGGTSFSGVDCSGFVQTVFVQNGVSLPRTADAQYTFGRRVRAGALRKGDLVFFETYAAGASHVGIYLGSGRFIHASSSSGVRLDSLGEYYYSARFIGGRRLVN